MLTSLNDSKSDFPSKKQIRSYVVVVVVTGYDERKPSVCAVTRFHCLWRALVIKLKRRTNISSGSLRKSSETRWILSNVNACTNRWKSNGHSVTMLECRLKVFCRLPVLKRCQHCNVTSIWKEKTVRTSGIRDVCLKRFFRLIVFEPA